MAFETIQNEVVLQLENQKDLLTLPIKQSKRIKYTCFAVSKNFIIFGATSGGLYTFKRNPCAFWQLIPSKESAIALLSISPSENFIAYATNKSIICVLELNEQTNCKLVIRTDDLADSEITSFCWSDDVYKPTLYIGDCHGKVSSLRLSFLSKSILHLPTTLSMTLDSRIIQLCWQNDFLLASTLTRCFLCDTTREQFKQIGQQLRDGYYGATFVSKGTTVRVFCARPGSRLWEVDLNSVVHSTHQFKQALATPPTPFISLFNEPKIIETKETNLIWPPQSFNFLKLYDLLGTYVVTFKKDALYILNVDSVDVLFWSNCFGEIVDVQCTSNTIFVWNSNGELHELAVLSINKCLLSLYLKQIYGLCVTIICRLYDKLISQESHLLAELNPFCDLDYSQLTEEEEKILSKFRNEVTSCSSKNIKLNSGIHVVNNRHFSSLLLDDSKLETSRRPRSLLRSDSDEIRKRSHSLPSNLKKDETKPNEVNGYQEEHSRNDANQRFTDTDNLYLEMGLYNSPFITLASYEILEECISDLSSSVSEKFNESSKSLKQKWKSVENKLKFLQGTKSKEGSNENHHNAFTIDEVIFDEEDIEPVVHLGRRKSNEVDANYTRIIELCEQDSNVLELLNFVVKEYQTLGEKHGIHKYEQFPFFIPEKASLNAKRLFKQFLTKDSLREWFEHESFPITVDPNFTEMYPPLLLEIFSQEQLRFDFFLCKTLVIFSEIMHAPTILETIKSLDLACYYLSFCYIMKYFQNSEILERNHYTRGNSAHWPLPVYLNTMLLMISLDQVDVFCEMGLKKNIDVTDVIYMMFHLEYNESKQEGSNNKYKNICLTYLQKHYECRDFDSQVDVYIVCLVLKMLAIVNDKFDLCCSSCWFLLPDSPSPKIRFLALAKHLLSYLWNAFQSACSEENSHSQQILLIMRQCITDTTEYKSYSHLCYKNMESCAHIICARLNNQIDNVSESVLLSFNIVCSFCHRIPELWRYLCVLQHNSRFKVLYPEHLIQLGNIAEVESVLPKITIEEARTILKLKSSLTEGFCLNCECKIPMKQNGTSWNELTLFILRRLGAKSCLKILEEFTETIKLEKSFYRSIILSSIPGVNSDLVDSVITAVSNEHNLAPVSKNVAEELDKALKIDRPDQEFTLQTSDVHHWGMAIDVEDGNQAICYCCSLPLFSKYLIKEDNGGIIVFSCSHTYHTICLKNKDCTATCLVCDRFLR